MLLAPDIATIRERLRNVPHEPWGPNGLRYVCVLIWNDVGHRSIYNSVDPSDWKRMGISSGEFWDLFLAGCAVADSDWYEEYVQMPLPSSFGNAYWMPEKSAELAEELEEAAQQAGIVEPWSFSGPIEMVAIGARRSMGRVSIDWASLRSRKINANQIGDAVAHYTSSHLLVDDESTSDWPRALPRPGDFEDDLPREIRDQFTRKAGTVGGIARLLRALFGG